MTGAGRLGPTCAGSDLGRSKQIGGDLENGVGWKRLPAARPPKVIQMLDKKICRNTGKPILVTKNPPR